MGAPGRARAVPLRRVRGARRRARARRSAERGRSRRDAGRPRRGGLLRRDRHRSRHVWRGPAREDRSRAGAPRRGGDGPPPAGARARRSDACHLSRIPAPERRPRRRSRPAPAGLGRPRGPPRGARHVLRARGRGEERHAAFGDHRRASRRRAVEPPPGCGKRGRGSRRDGLGRGRVARGPGGPRPAVCRRRPLASRDGGRQAPVRSPRRRGQALSRGALGPDYAGVCAVVVRGTEAHARAVFQSGR